MKGNPLIGPRLKVVREADPARQAPDAAHEPRMSHVFHRSARSEYPVAVSGAGPYLIDAAGKRYLDASGGAAVSCLGHGHPAVIEAIKAQADKLAYAHTSFFSSEPAESLADWLIEAADGAYERVYFVSGGSEGIGYLRTTLDRKFFPELWEARTRL